MPSPPSPVRAAVRSLADGLLGLAYPSLCLGCEGRLPGPAEALCSACLRGLPRADGAVAARMLASAPVGRAVCLWAHDPGGTVRRVQHALKYGGRPSLGLGLGRVLARALASVEADVVVPVPLSRLRELERGYNQAASLAEGVAAGLGVPVADLVVRSRPTRAQSTLSAAARRANVAGAFAVAPGARVAGLRVLLVDDVLTTGATLAAAAAPLAAAGASVDVAALCLAGA